MSDFKNLKYFVMPVDQGQIVTPSYAVDGEYLYRQTHDRSDNTTSYSRAEIFDDSENGFEPQNNKLPDHNEWEEYNDGKYHITDECGYDEIIESDGDMEHMKDWCREEWQGGSWDNKCMVSVYIDKLGWGNDVVEYDEIQIECGKDSGAEFIANAEVEHGQCYAALIGADLIDEFGGLLWAVPDYCDDYCDTAWMLHYTCMNGVELKESIEKLKFGYAPNGSTPNPHTAKVLEDIRIKNRAGV